ncbi:Uncharacterised protein [Vibrio cholerae]|nr:Uncharacterised protein [Vibrio cholerae]CSI32897.1 Uncharacterised protein [Vibrio cholerae]
MEKSPIVCSISKERLPRWNVGTLSRNCLSWQALAITCEKSANVSWVSVR